ASQVGLAEPQLERNLCPGPRARIQRDVDRSLLRDRPEPPRRIELRDDRGDPHRRLVFERVRDRNMEQVKDSLPADPGRRERRRLDDRREGRPAVVLALVVSEQPSACPCGYIEPWRHRLLSLRLLRRRVIIAATTIATATTVATAVTGVVLSLVVGDPHHNGPLHPLRVVDDEIGR